MEHVTQNAQETKTLGKKIAIRLTPSKNAKILALTGDLGSGKTTFVQGFAEALGVGSRIISPTFVLMRIHKTKTNSKFKNLIHIDLYRLEENIEAELANLGLLDEISNPENIIIIEWAEKAKDFLPSSTVWISFNSTAESQRKIIIKNP